VTAETVRLSACREAVRAVRAAECAQQAYASVRPRGVTGLIRARGPLALILWVAAAEARLVWRDGSSFALLEPPMSTKARGGGFRLAMARIAVARWELLVFALPPVILLATAAVMALWPATLTVAGIVVASSAAMYVIALMLGCVATIAFQLVRGMADRSERSVGRRATAMLSPRHWTLTLLHHDHVEDADDLLGQVAERVERLVRSRGLQASLAEGMEPLGGRVFEVLLITAAGVTTAATRDWLPAAQRVSSPYGISTDVLVLDPLGRTGRRPSREFNTASFFCWYVGGGAAVLAMVAWIVADREIRACAGSTCVGRPVTYGAAWHWLAQRLLFTDPPGLHPQAPGAWEMGWLVSILGLMAIPVGIVAVRQEWSAMRRTRATFDAHVDAGMSRTRVLLLVATLSERDATLAVAREKYGLAYVREARPPHVIFRFSRLSNVDILLAHITGTSSAPSGTSLALPQLVSECQPDYVLLTGTCLGLKPAEQRLGDVVVARQARDLDHRALTTSGVRDRGLNQAPSSMLLSAFAAASSDWHDAGVHLGPMLASGTLFNDEVAIADLRERHPDAVGADMETHDLYGAANELGVAAIAVRGISDWGYDRRNTYSEDAARRAADYVLHTIRAGLIGQPVPRPSQAGR
jgi:nucleoside phosphorylase